MVVHWERQEMCNMSKASEIARNVWLGPTPDSLLCPSSENDDESAFDILIEANDLAQSPDVQTLKRVGELSYSAPQHIEHPSSGSIMPQAHTKKGSDPLKTMCQWIYKLANPKRTREASEDEGKDERSLYIAQMGTLRAPFLASHISCMQNRWLCTKPGYVYTVRKSGTSLPIRPTLRCWLHYSPVLSRRYL